jgi:dihydrofolate reductase
MGEAIGKLTDETILLGRRTFEMFAMSWPNRTAEDDPGAPFFNESPKYVVSSTLESHEWSNSHFLGPYDPKAIEDLKQRIDGTIYVSGSAMLVRAMLADELVDELHLFVYPLTLGSGERLFVEGDPQVRLMPTEVEVYDSGVAHLGYRPAD